MAIKYSQSLNHHIFPVLLLLLVLNIRPSAQNVGYIGPACAVTEDSLFIHGIFVKKLDAHELGDFYKYQGRLEILRQLHEALAAGSASVAPNSALLFGPDVPEFCNGLDGTVEVVLNGCIVRKNNVYMAGKIVRPLSPGEKEKIDALVRHSNSQQQFLIVEKERKRQMAAEMMERKRRAKRMDEPAIGGENKQNKSTGPFAQPHRDIASLLGHFLNINASVAQRFLPMAKQSPLLERLNDSLAKALGKQMILAIRERRRKIVEEAVDAEEDHREGQKPGEEFLIGGENGEGERGKSTGAERASNESQSENEAHYNQIPESSPIRGDSVEGPLADSAGGGGIPHLIIGVPPPASAYAAAAAGTTHWAGQHYPQQMAATDDGAPHTSPQASGINAPNEAPLSQMNHQNVGIQQQQIYPPPSMAAPQHYHQYAAAGQQHWPDPAWSYGGGIKPGETIIVGGETYMAVPLSAVPQFAQQQQYSGTGATFGPMPSPSTAASSFATMTNGQWQQQQQFTEAAQQPQQQQASQWHSYPAMGQANLPSQQQSNNGQSSNLLQQWTTASYSPAYAAHLLANGYGLYGNYGAAQQNGLEAGGGNNNGGGGGGGVAQEMGGGGKGEGEMALPNEICQIPPL